MSATEIINAPKNPAQVAPFAHIGNKEMKDLDQLATIVQKSTIQPLPVNKHPEERLRVREVLQSVPKNHPLAVSRAAIGPKSVKLPQSVIKTHPLVFPRVSTIPQSAKFPQSAV